MTSGRLPLWSVSLLLSAVATVCAQPVAVTAKAVQQSLETELKGKELPIRGFLGAPVVHYAWKSGHMERNRENVYTVGVFQMEAVKVHVSGGQVDTITLRGLRRTVLKDDAGSLVLSKAEDPVSFEIQCQDLDDAEVARLPAQLFFPDLATAVKALPAELAAVLPARVVPAPPIPPGTPFVPTAGIWIQENGAWRQLPIGEKTIPPKVTTAPQPLMTSEARRARPLEGAVGVTLLVNSEGVPSEAWLARPLGYGLDETAVASALAWRFNPATYEGKAVGLAITVVVSFKVT